MSFRQKDVEGALASLWKPDWDAQGAKTEDWAVLVAHRLRALCRHASQGRYKSPKPAWVADIWREAGAEAQQSSAQEFVYVWDKFMRNMWRSTSAEGQREYAVRVCPREGEPCPIAVFADGAEREVTDISVEELEVPGRIAIGRPVPKSVVKVKKQRVTGKTKPRNAAKYLASVANSETRQK